VREVWNEKNDHTIDRNWDYRAITENGPVASRSNDRISIMKSLPIKDYPMKGV
jgi:hypothetical protein